MARALKFGPAARAKTAMLCPPIMHGCTSRLHICVHVCVSLLSLTVFFCLPQPAPFCQMQVSFSDLMRMGAVPAHAPSFLPVRPAQPEDQEVRVRSCTLYGLCVSSVHMCACAQPEGGHLKKSTSGPCMNIKPLLSLPIHADLSCSEVRLRPHCSISLVCLVHHINSPALSHTTSGTTILLLMGQSIVAKRIQCLQAHPGGIGW